jgi:hypothetical protein
MSDRTAGIDRWTISTCPECGVKLEWGDQWECQHYVLPHDGREVEVVPASQFAGAVKERDWLRRALLLACDHDEQRAARFMVAAEDAAATNGGQ